MKYRKKPVVIEAEQLNSRGLMESDWFWDAVTENKIITHNFGKNYTNDAYCKIETLEGTMTAETGWWIIKGVLGELYACDPIAFEKSYEAVEDGE